MRRAAGRVISQLLPVIAGCGLLSPAFAGSVCDLVKTDEATRLLGASAAGGKVAQEGKSGSQGCLIASSGGRGDSLRLTVETIAAEDAPRLLQHVDDERGDEKPSMHGETWFEISVPDANDPHYRRMIVHRDRTMLILDLHSAHQKNAKAAFESVWYQISERLPADSEE